MSVVFGQGGYHPDMVVSTVRGLAHLGARHEVFAKIDVNSGKNQLAAAIPLREGKVSVSNDFNRRFGNAGLTIAPDQVVLFKRCALGVATSLQFLWQKIGKHGDANKPKVLLIRPTYSLFADTLKGLDLPTRSKGLALMLFIPTVLLA